MTSPSGLIFDMDGVLVDSEEAHLVAWQKLGDEIGIPFSKEVFESTFGMHNRQILPLWIGEELAEDVLTAHSDRKEALYREAARDTLKPLPGIPERLHELHEAGWKLAVGSSGPKPNVEMVLEILGTSHLFTALSTGDDVKNGKPHPEVFLKAVERLELPAERCIVIEDAPQGVTAGLRAGAKVVAVTSTKPREELSESHWVVDCLTELSSEKLMGLL